MESLKNLLGFVVGVVGIIIIVWAVPTGIFLGALQGVAVLSTTSSTLLATLTFSLVSLLSFILIVLVGGILNFIGNSLVD